MIPPTVQTEQLDYAAIERFGEYYIRLGKRTLAISQSASDANLIVDAQDWHPWLTDLRAMARLLRGELEPPHNKSDDPDAPFGRCDACQDARRLQAEARPVADVEVLIDGDDFPGEGIVRINGAKHTVTRRLSLCSHGHLFTPCEFCEYDKVAPRVTDDWRELVEIDPDRLYGMRVSYPDSDEAGMV